MKLAVVILNWNGIDHLKTFLPSVLRHSGSFAVYVIDNASTDGSVAWLRTQYPEVQIVVNQHNEGFCRGYNLGLKQIEAEYYVLLNSDVEVTENWIRPVFEKMESEPTIAACQPKILSYSNRQQFEYAGAAGGYIDWLGYPFCRGRIFDTLEADKGQYDSEEEIFWASGACFFVRSSLFQQLGGFDEAFFAHMEEIDLCWRLKNRGHKILVLPSSVVYHVGGGTLQASNPFKTYLNYRNGLFLLYKNLPEKRLFSTLLIRLCLDGVSGLRHLVRFEFRFVWAILKAHFAYYRTVLKGTVTRDYKGQKEPSHMLYKSIVLEYFLNKKKVFSAMKP
jgi:GT2 family glycosyltransferase